MLLSSAGEESKANEQQLFVAVMTKPIRQHILSKQVLNALKPHASAPPEEVVKKKLSADFCKKYPYVLLVAEGNLMNQHVIVHILNKLGYEPDVVKTGREALDAVNQKDYGMILMDMQMPVMDGMEATRVIRKKPSIQPVIVALTANTMEGDQQICLDAGMDDYIGKPIQLDELMGKLEKWSVHAPGSLGR
jgi:CheY-like chemotaxis protein